MPNHPKPTVVYVVGPTAAGKTALGVQLAQMCDGEVVSADSRQVYRGLDIGTGKATPAEMAEIPHHLIDIADIDTIYTGADFVRDADAAIDDVQKRERLPIVAGGTFFYVQLLRRQMAPAPVGPNPELRATLEQKTTTALYETLQEKDPRRAHNIDPHNRRRLVRALEIVDALGAVPPVEPGTNPYREILIGVDRPDDALRDAFRTRALAWLERGLVDEVADLLARGVSRARLAEIGFEYTLTLDLYDGIVTEAEYLERFVAKNWQYAKQQRRWLQREPAITWFTPETTAAAIAHVQHFLTHPTE